MLFADWFVGLLFFVLFHRFDETALTPDIHIDQYAESAADKRKVDRRGEFECREEVVSAHDHGEYGCGEPCLFEYCEKFHSDRLLDNKIRQFWLSRLFEYRDGTFAGLRLSIEECNGRLIDIVAI